ncbi:hypothetical protein BDP27DRAFT_131152 [Rhodocollybia butyracea]|uniref:Uncharacterized protein n=1 Tax=Rhodocollybia butyracea TaxID=206335 RepID=A0A9P5P2S2_9AGAR|nr:hypothetical protein BDP27DRAFT_131152 [Rhodocollybia butyracea]
MTRLNSMVHYWIAGIGFTFVTAIIIPRLQIPVLYHHQSSARLWYRLFHRKTELARIIFSLVPNSLLALASSFPRITLITSKKAA